MARVFRIVFATTGSHGDLHPVLAVAAELAGRGHAVTVATDQAYRQKVESAGVAFAWLRPGLDDVAATHPEFYRRINDAVRGPEYIVRELVLPWLERSAEDLLAAAQGADLLVSHPITYAAPVVAEKLGIRWAAVALQPLVFFSAHEPPVIPRLGWLHRFRGLGPRFHGPLFGLMRRVTWRWMRPVDDLRRKWSLPPAKANPLFDGQFSPTLNLGLFSPLFAAPQPDWPPHTVATGFPIFREPPLDAAEAERLEAFLGAGAAPVVFTLGTTAVNDAGDFFRHSLAAVAALGCRAIFLIGKDPRNALPAGLPDSVTVFNYLPFGLLLPRAAVTVHQGGVGTTAQALRSGRPQIVVPFANDQPDNAARVARLGVGVILQRHRFSTASLTRALREVLASSTIAAAAARLGQALAREEGAARAADAIEADLAGA